MNRDPQPPDGRTAAAAETPVPGLAEIAEQLRALNDRFDRKILDDRDKRRLIEHLHDRMRATEQGQALEYLAPLIHRIAMVVDRFDRYLGYAVAPPPGTAREQVEFVESVRAELLSALRQHRVTTIPAAGPVDPHLHEVVEVRGEVSADRQPEIVALVRRGYRYGGVVLRPAQVVAGCPEGEEPTVV
ncbi:nucleotide exchange factor GrpE [Thermobifida halotolerans]|uniref:Nucleotide exchange factor GrpE n=1 Tax=Thermobifida halotolerans TaxID=483545 RepID=A0A399FYX9_9ACTN|nr:nucleotide exchange factor GrpE [Thermobifida halotolerans]UOE18909.1 nucleotide exchange factor GrpE [Thermobifida halotolerans]